MTYAVLWCTGHGPAHAGRLALLDESLLLEGTSHGVESNCEVRYGEVVSVGIGRSTAERLGGRPVAVIRRLGGETLRVAMLGGAGLLPELVEQLDAARAKLPVR